MKGTWPASPKSTSFIVSRMLQSKYKNFGILRGLKVTHLVLLLIVMLHANHSEAELVKAELLFPR